MRRVELFVGSGEYVATVEIAPFPDKGMPRIIVWGERFFALRNPCYDRPWAYEEVFTVVSFTPSPGLERQPPPAPPPVIPTPLTAGVVDDPSKLDTTIGPGGQQKNYLVLSVEERAKGYVRPVRRSYRHVGTPGPRFPLVDLTEEQKQYGDEFAKYEPYPESERKNGRSSLGRFWTQEELDKVGKGCGAVTTMGAALAETYARSPGFYGGTFCATCGAHFPVGKEGEFVWEPDGSRVGT